MADIPTLPLATTTPATTSTASAANLVAIQVAIDQLSAALESLTHTIQTSATVTSADPTNGLITLATSLGDISLRLTQNIGTNEKQRLTQTLLNLVETQRPLTISLQPGSSTNSKATLILSLTQPASTPQTTPQTALPQQSAPLPQIKIGDTARAVVLPASQPSITPQPTIPPQIQQLQTQQRAQPQHQPQTVSLAPFEPQSTPVQTTPPQQAPATAQSQPSLPTTPQPTTQPAATPQPTPTPTAAPAPTPTPSPAISSPQPTLPTPQQPTQQPAPPTAPAATQQPAPQTPQPSSPQPLQLSPQPQPEPVPFTPPPTNATPQTTPQSQPPVQTQTITSPAPEPAAQSTAAPLTQTSTPTQPTQPQQQPAPKLTIGSEIQIHVDAIYPPATPAVSIPRPAPTQITATVVGYGTNGQMLAQETTTGANLYVKAPVSAPLGSTLVLTVSPAPAEQLTPLPPLSDNVQFQSLPQLLSALSQANPSLFHHVMASAIPQPNEALPAALFLLFGAFSSGDAKTWLGEETRKTLAAIGKDSLYSELSKDIAASGQNGKDTVVGEWRNYPIPLFVQQQFQSLTLHVHHDRDARSDNAAPQQGAKKVRFLIDMRLSRLGDMQLDGFVQPKKLDMVLRSEEALPPGLPNELRTAYIKALDAVGYTGALNFQIGRQHWMVMERANTGSILT